MSFISKLFKKSRYLPASFLCQSMAKENDRVIRNQIEMWVDPHYNWGSYTPPTTNKPKPESLAMARLMGAAAPIAVIRHIEPEIEEKLIGGVIVGYEAWSNEAEMFEFDRARAIDLLNTYIEIIANGFHDPQPALRKLADSWFEAIAYSWGDQNYIAFLKEQRDEQIIGAVSNQNAHAAAQL